MQLLDELKMRPAYTMGYFILGTLCAVTGRMEEAVTHMHKARDMYHEMGMDYWLRRTQEVLERVKA
jgi:hypothetical protein